MRRIPWLLSLFLVITTETAGLKYASSKKDPHGGIPMGVHAKCDDGKNGIEIDWDKNSTDEYTCYQDLFRIPEFSQKSQYCTTKTDPPTHVCIYDKITYKDRIPTSGSHRPVWPTYGEYTYIPPQRWIHSLEHGGVVFLYHPCADEIEVKVMRNLANTCLRRYILTPSKRLDSNAPFAVLTWGCKLLMNRVDKYAVQKFIKGHAKDKHLPERNVWSDGAYNESLIEKSKVVYDMADSKMCPNFKPKPKKSRDMRLKKSFGRELRRSFGRDPEFEDLEFKWPQGISDHDFGQFAPPLWGKEYDDR